MSTILIVYDSVTGNTEKMARAVAEGAEKVRGANVIVKRVEQVSMDDLLGADGIIVGSPTYFGQMSGKMKDLIDRSDAIHGKLNGKVAAAFTSAGEVFSGAETALLSMIHAMLTHGMIVQGRVKGKHYGVAAVESPGPKDLDLCIDLGYKTASLVAKLAK